VTDSYKHSSLLHHGINCRRKNFLTLAARKCTLGCCDSSQNPKHFIFYLTSSQTLVVEVLGGATTLSIKTFIITALSMTIGNKALCCVSCVVKVLMRHGIQQNNTQRRVFRILAFSTTTPSMAIQNHDA
jgi:hypothetical protein